MSMRYLSTRGQAPSASFEDVLFAGLAADGGLFVPESWPVFDRDRLAELQNAPYQDIAAFVLQPFVEGALSNAELCRLIDEAYGSFRHRAVAPLTQLAAGEWMMELFMGRRSPSRISPCSFWAGFSNIF